MRVINDMKEPSLFHAGRFVRTDHSVPENWVCKGNPWDDGYYGPPEFDIPGFFDDYFDKRPGAVEAYEKVLRASGIDPGD